MFVSWPCLYCGESQDPRGIDRWDNNIGYEFNNCRPCCAACNKAKGTMGGEEFIALCQRVVSFTLMGKTEMNDIFEVALNNNAGE